jgi:prepilin-type N-terminal cleavage/methylation domain-containing protein
MIKSLRKKGFTIVELVIVIAVIAILAAILIPTFTSVVNKAEASKIQSELKSAYTQYVAEASDVQEYVEGYAHILFGFEDNYYDYDGSVFSEFEGTVPDPLVLITYLDSDLAEQDAVFGNVSLYLNE